jgi:pumilio family protein 6
MILCIDQGSLIVRTPPFIESRNEQKNTRKERKAHDRSFDMITEAKKVWEQLRRGDIKREEQKALMEKMMSIIQGRVQDVSGRR